MKVKKGEGFERIEISCLDNKKGGNGVGGEGFGGKTYTNFIKNIISPKVERF